MDRVYDVNKEFQLSKCIEKLVRNLVEDGKLNISQD
jgi:hypothetical protein